MIRVKLLTRWGEFVTSVLMPPMLSMPEVLIWGQRIFQLNADREYREAFAMAVFDEQTMRVVYAINDRAIEDYVPPPKDGK